MSSLAREGDTRHEILNNSQAPRVGRTPGPKDDEKMSDSQRKKLLANRMKSKEPIPPEQTKKPPGNG